MSRGKRSRRARRPRNPAEAFLARTVAAGRDLAVPDCRVHADCGGCTWQRIAYPRQLEEKGAFIRRCFAEAGLPDAPFEGVIGSPDLYAYRNIMEFSFSGRRWLTRAEIASGTDFDRELALGLHAPGGIGRVLDLERCSIQDAASNRTLDLVRRFARASGRPAWRHDTHEGFWRYLRLRRGARTGQRLVGVVTAARDADLMADLSRALEAEGLSPTVLANGVTERVADTSEGALWHVDRGPEAFEERLGPFVFGVQPASFFQPNTRTAEIIFALAASMAGAAPGGRVLDLFCGAGTLSLHLSRVAETVVGLELSEGSIADARRNAARNGVDNVRFEVRDLLAGLPDDLGRFDVVVTDPPRAGMHARLVAELAAMAPPRIVSVGCNPKTQARDLAALCADGRYVVARMAGVDQFPHTPHVENVALLMRADVAGGPARGRDRDAVRACGGS